MDNKSNKVLLENMLAALQLELPANQKIQLQKYVNLLLEGLKKQRLTGDKTAAGIIGKHLYDSLYPLRVFSFSGGSRMLDLGSGAGLPGLPIKICLPEVNMFLLDANRRKINFLKISAERLGLEQIECFYGRAEEFAHDNDHREKFDYVLARAVAETVVLAELALPMLKVGGQAILYKGPRGDQEADLAEKAIALCGGEIDRVCHYDLPTGEKRSLYAIKKVKHSPPHYPRAVGKPNRRPLI